MKRQIDEYGFPVPEGFDDEPRPARRAPRVAPLVVLPLVTMVVTGIASAIKFWPQWVDHAQQFAVAFDRRSGALEQAEHRIRRNPNDLSAYLLRGDEYLAREDYPRAIRDYRRVLRELPDDGAVRRRLATALNNFAYQRARAGEDLHAALEDVEDALKLAPPNAAFLDTRGYLYYLLGRYDEAQRDLDLAVQLAQEELRTAHPRFARWHHEALTEILQHRDLLEEELERRDDATRDRPQLGQ